jgi:hypothetical protein
MSSFSSAECLQNVYVGQSGVTKGEGKRARNTPESNMPAGQGIKPLWDKPRATSCLITPVRTRLG